MSFRGDVKGVAKGLGLVAEKLIERNQPFIADHLFRLQRHALEVANGLREFVVENKESHQRSSTYGTNEAGADEKVVPADKKSDPIGFSSIIEEDDQNARIHHDDISKDRSSMREREVPSTQFQRFVGFGSLAARMTFGYVGDRASRLFAGETATTKGMSEENAERLAETLCRMRGAALKLGQMLSVQDETLLPPALSKALDRVKQGADYMPKKQLYSQLQGELGKDWKESFVNFDDIPVAAASIGQVHKGKLKDGRDVAIKVQYPGVASSIQSDLTNLKSLITMADIVPKGMFIDQIIKVANEELSKECDYHQEAIGQREYRNLILSDSVLSQHTFVPEVISNLSSKQILTTDFVQGVTIDKATLLTQPVRNAIARTMLLLTITEVFKWRFVQSDPNFANFLYDHPSRKINLIDFGAVCTYKKEFIDDYLKLVWAAANKDDSTIITLSKRMGFLSGDESEEMVTAHVGAGLILGEPFFSNEPYDFANSSLAQRLTGFGDTFLKHRLVPPPTESYTLHRKLAGAFLLCIRLRAQIPCRDLLEEAYNSYDFN